MEQDSSQPIVGGPILPPQGAPGTISQGADAAPINASVSVSPQPVQPMLVPRASQPGRGRQKAKIMDGTTTGLMAVLLAVGGSAAAALLSLRKGKKATDAKEKQGSRTANRAQAAARALSRRASSRASSTIPSQQQPQAAQQQKGAGGLCNI